MQDGSKRSCDNCNKILEPKFFPYKSIPHCLWCYEEINNKTLHSVRRNLKLYESGLYGLSSPKQANQDQVTPEVNNKELIVGRPSCPYCKSNRVQSKGRRDGRQRYACQNCRRSWTGDLSLPLVQQTAVKKTVKEIERKTPTSEIKKYLQEKKRKSEPIRFYYRDDTQPRGSNNYYFDDTYVYFIIGYSRRKITFRIDKIRKI